MTLQSVIAIKVDDSEWEHFQKKYQEFQANNQISLGMPVPGGQTSPSLGEHASHEGNLQNVVGLLSEIRDLVKGISDSEDSSGSGSNSPSTGLPAPLGFLKGGLKILGPIGAAIGGFELMKKLTELPSFILHGAGLSDQATNATAVRSAARGLGVSSGVFRAYQTDLAPYGDGEGLLRSVSSAQSDITNPANMFLRSAGIGPSDSVEKGSEAVLKGLRQAYLDTRDDPGMLKSTLQYRQLDSFGDPEFARQLGSVSQSEFNGLLSNLHKDSSRLSTPDQTAKVWQDLNQSLTRSKQQLETVFVNSLPAAARAETLAVDKLTSSLTAAAERVDKLFPGLTTEVNSNTSLGDLTKSAGKDLGGIVDSLKLPDFGSLSGFSWEHIKDFLHRTESKTDHDISPKGAIGRNQVMPKTAAAFGITPEQLLDPAINDRVAGNVWDQLLKQFQDPYKAAAAYNWGSGNLSKDIAKYGDKWQDHLPLETKNYISNSTLSAELDRIAHQQTADVVSPQSVVRNRTGNSPRPRSSDLTITNSTGHDVYVQSRLVNR